MNNPTTSADLALAEALAAQAANEKAITVLMGERERLLDAETVARETIARGGGSRKILKAMNQNASGASALLLAIEFLAAQRPGLVWAVDHAIGELWAE